MPKIVIDSFFKQYRFLSNFFPAKIIYDGMEYPTVEHAFQAAKTDDAEQRFEIQTANCPATAKKLGRRVSIRHDWDVVKIDIMTSLVFQKFANDEILKQKLLATYPHELVEGNYWNDTFWGVCRGTGTNNLGKILMEVRNHFRAVE